jgi:hypothetical protein
MIKLKQASLDDISLYIVKSYYLFVLSWKPLA